MDSVRSDRKVNFSPSPPPSRTSHPPSSLSRLLKRIIYYTLLLHRILTDYLSTLLFRVYYTLFHPRRRLPAPPSSLLLESATFLAQKIRAGDITSAELVNLFIQRIEAVNPVLNVVVAERFQEARREARLADQALASGLPEHGVERQPFLGVPFTTKECIRVTGLPNTSGLYLRQGFVATEDADVVRLMRQAGAIPLAVTNISEICMWWESSNKIYGQSRNPYNTQRIVGGSSGGEAALLAAAGSPFGIGSDIGGSIRMPAFFNGIFGHKPTFGIVPNRGQFPDVSGNLSKFLTTGPMCRFAEDLVPMLKVLAGEKADRLNLDSPVDISRLRVHFASDDGGFPLISPVQPSIKTALLSAVHHLSDVCGAELVSSPQISGSMRPLRFSLDIWSSMMSQEKCHSFAQDMANREGEVNAPLELLKWLLGQSQHTFPAVLLGVVEMATARMVTRQTRFAKMCGILEAAFVEMLGSDGVFLYPTHPRTAPYHHQPLTMPFNFAYTAIFNALGLPSCHVPLGLDAEGLPLGVQVVSNHYNDRLCLAVAAELEKGFGGWVCP
ncbi:fatty-acid amide hydrolase 2-like [Paramacrobiotus metropolitanus]|uniref:fatty-acid amide hydrolase 2-like n=1 Tax=Paramacrobiotus metropolitanus TaxID=2943436 RepID=UPI00244636A1|nr:fatty-acid amide hydrolase 2-like [Paramacrobiotus metropolitanus]